MLAGTYHLGVVIECGIEIGTNISIEQKCGGNNKSNQTIFVCVRFVFVLLPRPKTLFLERYYFHRRVSVCVCVCVYPSINSKSSGPIFLKFGRIVYNDKSSVPFEDEINRIDRTQTSLKRVVKIDIKVTYL